MLLYMISYGLSVQSKYTIIYCILWTPGSIIHFLYYEISTRALKWKYCP